MGYVLGLNSPPLGWHDPAACLVDDNGSLVAFIEVERVSRLKHGLRTYPHAAVAECLRVASIDWEEVDVVAVGWDLPRHSCRQDLDRLDPPILGRAWRFGDSADFLAEATGRSINVNAHPEVVFVPHHTAHATSAVWASGMEDSAVVVADGCGDEESVSIYSFSRGRLKREECWPITHSLGLMYDAASELLGLSFLEAGKTMGLAAWGAASQVSSEPFSPIRDGFELPFDLSHAATNRQIKDAWKAFYSRSFGYMPTVHPTQLNENPTCVRLAHGVQSALERTFARLAARARALTGSRNLCLAGGSALNCSSNGLVPQPLFVPPFPHDAGVAVGAAWHVRPPRAAAAGAQTPFLGSRVHPDPALSFARETGLNVTPLDVPDLARRLLDGEIGGVVNGRAEAGPRALCHRSILASPRIDGMRDKLNRLKSRESWRPFGPVMTPTAAASLLPETTVLHQYMLQASKVTDLAHQAMPEAIHVDGTARAQVVCDPDEQVAELLAAVQSLGEEPVLINTSFNGKGEPIVNNAVQALNSAMRLGLSFVVVEDLVVHL
jgi:carbamoyltransferase